MQRKNRARPMAARLAKNNQPGAEREPRSAHGHAINKQGAEQELRSADGRAVKKNRVQSKKNANLAAVNPVHS